MSQTKSHQVVNADSSILRPTETREWWWDNCQDIEELFAVHGKSIKPAETVTLKGRLECRDDYKRVLEAVSNTPGVISCRYFREDETEWVEVSWLVRTYHYSKGWIDHSEDTASFVNRFIDNLLHEHDTHVYIESLKPVNECDGERNGFWGWDI